MAVTLKGQTAVYEGTSTDTKPTDADNNAIFKELDTDKRYYYDGTDWNEMPSSGSGGGFTPTSTQLAAMNSGITAEDVTQIETNENNIVAIKDGTTLDSFGDVETALGDKQDTISDLSAIRSGAAAGATAVQPATMETALDAKQDTLTTEQLAAVNSGIDSTKVAQIETNKNNISSLAEVGVKNFSPYSTGTNTTGNKWVIGSGAGNVVDISLPIGSYIFSATSPSTGSGQCQIKIKYDDETTENLPVFSFGSSMSLSFTISKKVIGYGIYSNAAPVTFENIMIRPDFADSTYQPYAKSNSELTALSAEDRANLVELVDGGAKNKLLIGTPTSVPAGLTCTRNTDGTYTVSGTLATANSISFNIDAIAGDLVLSGCPEGGGNDTYLLRITKSGSQVTGSVDTGTGSDVFVMDGTGYALNIRFAAGTYTNVIFKPMICSKAAWDISHSYVPYRPSYDELIARVEALENV